MCALFLSFFSFLLCYKRPTNNFMQFFMQMRNRPFEFSDELFESSDECPEEEEIVVSQRSKRPRRSGSHPVSGQNKSKHCSLCSCLSNLYLFRFLLIQRQL